MRATRSTNRNLARSSRHPYRKLQPSNIHPPCVAPTDDGPTTSSTQSAPTRISPVPHKRSIMPSQRRLRLLVVGLLAVVVVTLVYTSQMRAAEEADRRTINDFWHKTMNGLDRAHGQTVLDSKKGSAKGGAGKDEDDAQLAKDMRARLDAAAQKAKDSANSKVLRPEKPEQVIGVGSSAGGQTKGSKENPGDKAESKETDEEHQVESTINDILKKSPGETIWSHSVETVG